MSGATPYRECRTDDWAFLTPADAAVTVITSPIPSGRPTARKVAWRARRRSSHQRYVKNIRHLKRTQVSPAASRYGDRPGGVVSTVAARYRRTWGSGSD